MFLSEHLDMIKLLNERGASVNAEANGKITPLHIAAGNSFSGKCSNI